VKGGREGKKKKQKRWEKLNAVNKKRGFNWCPSFGILQGIRAGRGESRQKKGKNGYQNKKKKKKTGLPVMDYGWIGKKKKSGGNLNQPSINPPHQYG